MEFILFQKARVEKGEIVATTIRNYIKAAKLFPVFRNRIIPSHLGDLGFKINFHDNYLATTVSTILLKCHNCEDKIRFLAMKPLRILKLEIIPEMRKLHIL
jgi:hypothetical protein